MHCPDACTTGKNIYKKSLLCGQSLRFLIFLAVESLVFLKVVSYFKWWPLVVVVVAFAVVSGWVAGRLFHPQLFWRLSVP